jgi:hypothetical protein
MACTSLIKTISQSIQVEIEGHRHIEENSENGMGLYVNMFPSVDWIQNTAIINLFSKRGEMFSADNLAYIAEMSFQHFHQQALVQKTFIAHVIKKDVFSFLTSYEKMLDFFTETGFHQVLLVPYDSDHDQRPCKKKGHKSHWCVISGIATFLPTSKISHAKSLETLNDKSRREENERNESGIYANNNDYTVMIDDSSKVVVISKSNIRPKLHSNINEILRNEIFDQKLNRNSSQLHDEEPCFYLIAKQSKSKRTFLFDPYELANSNKNLAEVSPDQYMVQNGTCRNEMFNKYVIPAGGLSQGLASQVIVLKLQV